MRMSKTERAELALKLEFAPWVAAGFLALFALSLSAVHLDVRLVFCGVAIGLVAAVAISLNYRFYGPFSWLLWAIPVPGLAVAAWLIFLRDGSVSISHFFLQCAGLGVATVLGALWLLRQNIKSWVS